VLSESRFFIRFDRLLSVKVNDLLDNSIYTVCMRYIYAAILLFSGSAAWAQFNTDCGTKLKICNTVSITGNNTGIGPVSDLKSSNDGCLAGENMANWYYFDVTASGTFTFQILPNDLSDDYDFAIWGPNPACPPTTAPARCSYCVVSGNTGLLFGAGDNSETNPLNPLGTPCDKFVEGMNLLLGERYIIYIDNYSRSNKGFTLSFAGTAQFDCLNAIPVEMISFFAQLQEDKSVLLTWRTATERNNDYFGIERSDDGSNYLPVGRVDGSGTSTSLKAYRFSDRPASASTVYYRIRQVDFDGTSTFSKEIPIRTAKDGLQALDRAVKAGAGSLSFTYRSSSASTIRISVHNTLGQLVHYTERPVYEGETDIELSLQGLARDIHFLTVESDLQVDTQRFLMRE
jgi:hypothetical protein